MPILTVPSNIRRLIELGDAAITWVHQQVPFRSGNQRFALIETGGHAAVLTAAAQSAYGQGNWDRPLRNAAATMLMGAGNCQDLAAVAYVLLREVKEDFNVSFCVSWDYHHSFAAIGCPNRDNSDQIIIVDPWPAYAQAVRWTDHFCFGAAVDVRRCKPANQTGKFTKAAAKNRDVDPLEVVAIAQQAFNNQPIQAQYNHLWASKAQEKVVYVEAMDIS